MSRCLVVALTLWAGAALAQAEFIGSYTWYDPADAFGGFSGIEVFEGGARMVAISDRGWIAQGRLTRDGDQITGVADLVLAPIQDQNGDTLPRYFDDSEGLARAADGGLYISFEGNHRVAFYPEAEGPSQPMPRHPDFEGMQNNSSLEALAIDADGALYTLPERSGSLDVPFPIYRFRDGVWDQPFSLRRDPPFLPTGADIGPDGRFYLLERHFNGLGFETRVRRFAMDGSGEETLLQTGSMEHDNLEGISVWRDATGDLRLTLISDDNFRFFQRTEIVEYRLRD